MKICHHGSQLAAVIVLLFCAEAISASEPAPHSLWRFEKNLEDEGVNGCRAYTKDAIYTDGAEAGSALNPLNTAYVQDSPWLRAAPSFQINCRVRFNQLWQAPAWTTVAMKGTYTKGEYILRVNPAAEGGGFGFFLNTGGPWEPRVNSRESVHTGEWYRVSAGWDGTNIWMEVNGDRTQIKRSGLPTATSDPLIIGPFDGALDQLEIINPHALRTDVANWPFDGNLQDVTGHGHDASGKNVTFVSRPNATRALRAYPASVTVAHHPDITLAPGLRVGCSLMLEKLPQGYTTVLIKNGEYQLRVEKHDNETLLSFFVFVDNRWESRVTNPCNIEIKKWYDVIARWDGLRLILDVNGERAEIPRYGKVVVGTNPLFIGTFQGMIDNLTIENPRLPAISLSDVQCASVIPHAGRIEQLSARVCNFGSDATGCYVLLNLPPGVSCEGPVRIDIGDMPSGSERELSWKLRAEKSMTAELHFDVDCKQDVHSSVGKRFAVFPADDTDFGEAAWEPPAKNMSELAADFYVDAIEGSNDNDGQSPKSAWRDFSPVNGSTLGPGERLLIRRGSVINQELSVSAKGRPDAWAEIGTYGEGSRPIIHRNKDISERCATITHPDYLRIRGLVFCDAAEGLVVSYKHKGHRGLIIEDCIAHHIEGQYRPNAHGIPEWRDRRSSSVDGAYRSAGIDIRGSGGEDIILRNCEMFQCSWGFFMAGDNVVVDRVFCHDNFARNTSPHPAMVNVRRSRLQRSIFDAPGYHASAGTMGIMLVDPVALLIRECHFLNQPDSGSHDEGGIDFEARGYGCLIDRCTFRNNAGAAIEVLGLRSPQIRNLEITGSRFFCNNKASKLGPSEIFIWGRSGNAEVCCSTGVIRDNGYVLLPGVDFFTNQAPATTEWTLSDNRQYDSESALEQAMPLNNPPMPGAGPELWSDQSSLQLDGTVTDDGRTETPLKVRWELLEGPGKVSFEKQDAAATKAEFNAPGDYRLRLVADDGSLWRSSHTAVHILPKGAQPARAWSFAKSLYKEGWSEANLGTRLMQWPNTVSYPVNEPAGGFYVIAMENTPDACLISPDNLKVDAKINRSIVIRLQNHTTSSRMRINFTTAGSPEWDASPGKTFDVTAHDSQQRLYIIDMKDVEGWDGELKQLRLDFGTGTAPVTGTCRMDYLWVGNL